MKKYAVVWLRLAQMTFLMQLATRVGSLGWLGGKIVRLVFFLIFLSAIFRHVPSVAGYSIAQVAFFFLTFNVVDILAQIFFRGIYGVGRDIREGDFDFYLIQPLNPLFRVSSNMVDFLDFLTLIPVVALLAYIFPGVVSGVPGAGGPLPVLLYLALCANGVLTAFGLHLVIASLTVRTQQMENTIWLYRDLASLGRFPTDIYAEPVRAVLTVGLPIALMFTYPAKALLGLLSPGRIAFAFLFSSSLLFFGFSLWKSALKHYSSVSS